MAQLVKNLPATQETWVWSLVWEDPLEKGRLLTPVCWPGEFTDYTVHGVPKSRTRRVAWITDSSLFIAGSCSAASAGNLSNLFPLWTFALIQRSVVFSYSCDTKLRRPVWPPEDYRQENSLAKIWSLNVMYIREGGWEKYRNCQDNGLLCLKQADRVHPFNIHLSSACCMPGTPF